MKYISHDVVEMMNNKILNLLANNKEILIDYHQIYLNYKNKT